MIHVCVGPALSTLSDTTITLIQMSFVSSVGQKLSSGGWGTSLCPNDVKFYQFPQGLYLLIVGVLC